MLWSICAFHGQLIVKKQTGNRRREKDMTLVPSRGPNKDITDTKHNAVNIWLPRCSPYPYNLI